MANGDIWETYEDIWHRVEEEYRTGFCWSERGLQAVLYAKLRRFTDFSVLVEPTWGRARPDLVIVNENRITDIFELKFSPHTRYRREWMANDERSDVQKLCRYVGTKHPVSLDPETGQWDKNNCLRVPNDCRLHFVAVARCSAQAPWPQHDGQVARWCGCTGDYDEPWRIEFA